MRRKWCLTQWYYHKFSNKSQYLNNGQVSKNSYKFILYNFHTCTGLFYHYNRVMSCSSIPITSTLSFFRSVLSYYQWNTTSCRCYGTGNDYALWAAGKILMCEFLSVEFFWKKLHRKNGKLELNGINYWLGTVVLLKNKLRTVEWSVWHDSVGAV